MELYAQKKKRVSGEIRCDLGSGVEGWIRRFGVIIMRGQRVGK